MNETENQTEMKTSAGVEELQSDLQTLRVLIAITLVIMIGFSVCADYFLSRQVAFQTAEIGQLQMIVNNFPQNAANDFVAHLKEYYKTHPDFSPVALKYAALFDVQPSARPPGQMPAQPAPKPSAKK